MRLRGAVKPPIFALSFAARTYHARLARQTRARGKSSQREGNALFDDFCYFWSRKSTRKEKSHYESSRANNVRPYNKNQIPPKAKPKDIYLFTPVSATPTEFASRIGQFPCLGNAETGVYFIPLKSHPRRKRVLPLLPRLLPLPYRLLPPILFQPLRSLPLREPLPPLSFPPRHERV